MIKWIKQKAMLLIFLIFGGGFVFAQITTPEPTISLIEYRDAMSISNRNAMWATIKGLEISKIGKTPKVRRSKYDIEIISMEAVEGGVAVYVRAWDRKGQIGFGVSGTVDIERFVLINPGILVRDPLGDVVMREGNVERGLREIRGREDLLEAVYLSIENSLATKKQMFDSSRIIPEKIGRTTTNVVPTDDDSIFGSDATYTTAQAASDGTIRGDGIVQNTVAGDFFVERTFLNFADTSAVGSDDISSATVTVIGEAEGDVDTWAVGLYGSTASDNIVSTDLDLVQGTLFSDTKNVTGWNAAGSNVFTLTAAGIAQITKSTALTKMSFRLDLDVAITEPTGINTLTMELVTDGTDPVLSIEHAPAAATEDYNNSQIW